MNDRERILAVVVVGMLGFFVLTFGVRRVMDAYSSRQEEVAELEETIRGKELRLHRGKVARRDLDVYLQRSLPGDSDIAGSRYRAWLHSWLESAGVTEHSVKYQSSREAIYPGSGQTKRTAYRAIKFAVTCEVDLLQLTRLLYAYYRADHLQRIELLKVHRIGKENDKRLGLTMTLEALSLPTAAKDKPLTETISQRLAYDQIDDYVDVIVRRNPFAPANKPPRFASLRDQVAYLGQPFQADVSAQDPDNQSLRYSMVADVPGLSLDERSGRITWTPNELGEFELQITARDSGLPSQSVTDTMRITVREPRPEEPVAQPPTFDEAKYTFLTGVVQVNGRPQAWFTIRTRGEVLQLHEGETLKVGQFEGQVARIEDHQVTLIVNDAQLLVRRGKNISQAETVTINDE